MRRSFTKYALLLLASALLLSVFGPFSPAAAEETPPPSAVPKAAKSALPAEDLTARCKIESDLPSAAFLSRLTDRDYGTVQHFGPGVKLSVSWTEDVPVCAVFLSFSEEPKPYSVLQYDAADTLLSEADGPLLYSSALFLDAAARRVTIIPKEQIALCTLRVCGKGEIENYHPWEPTPKKTDYLMIAMHPDDDVLFLGAIVPIYTAQQGRTGTIFYAATRERIRKDEALNGAWTMGLRNLPILGDFPDIPESYREKFAHTFRRADVVKHLVGLIRSLRPEVVFSQDLDGEYGHWQHVLLAHAVQEAVPLAADPTYDPASAEQYGAWEVKKLYLHLYPERKIRLPVTEPLSAFGGRSAFDVAVEAFLCHGSQLPSRHAVRNEGVYSLSDFGLAYTSVGFDTEGRNDPFEHIETAQPAAPADTAAPLPTSEPLDTAESSSTPEPLDTGAPTEGLDPVDTPAQTETFPPNAFAPTAMPASTADPTQTDASNRSVSSAPFRTPLWVLLPTGVLLLALCALFFFARQRRVRILLIVLALLLLLAAAAGYLLLRDRAQKARQERIASLAELTVSDGDALPDAETLHAYTQLRMLDLRGRTDVTAAYVDAARTALPDGCGILWSVPMTDGLFDSDSTNLTLPSFGEADAALLPYFPRLTAVDASGSTAYAALLTLSRSNAPFSLRFTVPVGDRTLTMDDETLVAAGAPDLALLDETLFAFPALRRLDLSGADVDPAAMRALAAAHPNTTFSWMVPIGAARFDAASTALSLRGVDLPPEGELIEALALFPALASVDLHGTALSADESLRLVEALPNISFSFAATLFGQTYETDQPVLDLRETTCSADELAALLRPFSALETVFLPETAFDEAALLPVLTAHPNTLFVRPVTVLGKSVSNDAVELDVSKTAIASPDEVLDALAKLPRLTKLILCDCGLSDEQMERLLAERPDVKFVWNIHIRNHTIRTDATGFSTKNPSRFAGAEASDEYRKWVNSTVRLKEGDIAPLKYCTDLVALDLGHNFLTDSDLDVLQYLPHLQVLILADNRLTDISALAQLKELVYVELFMNNIQDVSPLLALPNLLDINICNIHLADGSALYGFTHAERLWFAMNDIPRTEWKAIADALPNCVCNYTTRDETGGGWREHPRYQWIRKLLNK